MEATNPVLSEYNVSKGPMQLSSTRFSGLFAPRGRHVWSGCQNCQIGRLGRQARVGFHGDLIEPSLVSGALISSLPPCIGVWLAVTLAAYCSPRRWSRDGAENSKKCDIGQCRTHRKLHNSG